MTSAITSPEIATKHPSEETWFQFNYEPILGEGETMLDTGLIAIYADKVGLTFAQEQAVIEPTRVSIFVHEGVDGVKYNLTCEADTTLDGITKFQRRVIVGQIRVRST